MMAHSLKNIAILNAKGDTFRCLLMGISKNKGLKRLKEYCKYEFYIKNWFSLIYIYIYIYFNIYKNELDCWFNLLSKNKDLILNKTKDFYKNNKGRLREQARDEYKSLSEEEKNKKI